jgi:hypothetical protein
MKRKKHVFEEKYNFFIFFDYTPGRPCWDKQTILYLCPHEKKDIYLCHIFESVPSYDLER